MSKEIVEQYCEQKEQAKVLENSIKKLNNQIKEELKSRDETGLDFGKYHVSLQTRTKEDFNEQKALDIILGFWHEHNGSMQCPFTRTVEVLDMEALESAIYKEELPKDVLLELDKCRVKTETTALTYKIDKEDK